MSDKDIIKQLADEMAQDCTEAHSQGQGLESWNCVPCSERLLGAAVKQLSKARVAGLERELTELRTVLAQVQGERDQARKYGEEMYKRELASCKETFCAYCGSKYPSGTPLHGGKALTAHIKICDKHPMRELEDRMLALTTTCTRLREALVTLREALVTCRVALTPHVHVDADTDKARNVADAALTEGTP